MPPVIIQVQKLPNQNQHNECETAIFECLRFIHLHLCIIDALEMLKVTYFTKIGKIFRSSETEGKKHSHTFQRRGSQPGKEKRRKMACKETNQPAHKELRMEWIQPMNIPSSGNLVKGEMCAFGKSESDKHEKRQEFVQNC